LPWLDVLRGIAIVLMVFFHFVWDAANFGLVNSGLLGAFGWKLFGLCILGAFLSVSGFSLTWAFLHGVGGGVFLRRILKVGLCAGLISLGTWLTQRDYFIYFGVLHHIALGSAILLLLLRWPAAVTAICAVAAMALPRFFRPDFLDQGWFWWLGLCRSQPASPDYVPLLPWFSIMLTGSLLARIASREAVMKSLGGAVESAAIRCLGWAGRKSLWIYMLHQPLLFGLFEFWVWLFPRAVP